MTDPQTKQIADRLDGIEYRAPFPKGLEEEAKRAGIVIITGSSDDLVEFRGALYDELGASDGFSFDLDQKGIIPHFEWIDKEGRDAKEDLRDYFSREGKGQRVIVHQDRGEAFWSFTTTIPHSTFVVNEDDYIHCRGVVLRLADAAPKLEQRPYNARKASRLQSLLHYLKETKTKIENPLHWIEGWDCLDDKGNSCRPWQWDHDHPIVRYSHSGALTAVIDPEDISIFCDVKGYLNAVLAGRDWNAFAATASHQEGLDIFDRAIDLVASELTEEQRLKTADPSSNLDPKQDH